MVDYMYKELYNRQHVDKQVRITACDFVGYGLPESKYQAKAEYEGKVYLDAETGIYYKCRNLSVSSAISSFNWKPVQGEYELLVFKNKDIEWENFELSESLCSESELRFGCCEASVLKFKIHNTFTKMKDKWLVVEETLDGHTDIPFQFGRYKVFSDVPTADRLYRDITAYDAMYDIINSSVVGWYNSIFPDMNRRVPMRQFRKSFIEHFGLKEVDPVMEVREDGTRVYGLVNDGLYLEKTISVEEGTEIDNETQQVSILKESSLSGLDVIRAICEINGCFGHIGRDGKFHYIYLTQDMMGLYPSNTLFPDHAPWYLKQSETGHLYPQAPKSTGIGSGGYKSCQYEDFICKRITRLQIRQEENDIGKIWPEGSKTQNDNCYVIENNFLVYGKSSDDLAAVAKNIFDKITHIVYRPFSADCIGNPCLEVGDPVRLPTKYELVESYILNRTLKGIQSLADAFSANGTEKYSGKINGVHNSIIQLKGKTNILIRNLDETRSELSSFEKDTNGNFIDVRSSIVQTAESITSTVSKATSKYDTTGYNVGLFGYFSPDDEKMQYKASENNGKYYLNQSDGNLYQSNGVSWVFVKKLEMITENLSSEIKQTAESITSTVARTEKIWSEKKVDGTPILIDKYGFGAPSKIMTAEEYKPGLKYLDQTSGMVYEAVKHHPLDRPQWVEWREYTQLEQVSTTIRSEIKQTADGIEQKVEDTERGLSSKIAQTVKSIDMSVTNGSTSATLALLATKENGSVITGQAKEIKFSGLVSFENLAKNDGKTIINGGNITTGKINCDRLDGGEINGQTFKGGKITGSNIEANSAYYIRDPDFDDRYRIAYIKSDDTGDMDLRFGRLSKNDFDSGYNYLAFKEISQDRSCHIYSDLLQAHCEFRATKLYANRYLDFTGDTGGMGVRVNVSHEGLMHYIIGYRNEDRYSFVGVPASNYSDTPTSTRLRGNSVVLSSAGSITTSDERVKNSFKPLDEFDNVYMDIEPCAFKYNNGTSGRYHFGVKAQDVKKSFEKHGYTMKDFGGFVQMSDSPENEDYCGVDDPMGIIYTEFIMWNMRKNQMQQKEIDFLRRKNVELELELENQKKEIDSLKESVSFLMERICSYEQRSY